MKYIDSFLQEKNVLPETKENYRRELCDLAEFWKTKDLLLLSAEQVKGYLDFVSERASGTTFARAFSVLYAYYESAYKGGVIDKNPLSGVRARDYITPGIRFLSRGEVEALLEYPGMGLMGLRDRAMLALLWETGLRVSELVSLDRDSFFAREKLLLCGEEKRKRTLCLPPYVVVRIEQYLAVLDLIPNRGEEKALFLNHKGERLTRQGFWKILKERGEECKIPARLTPQLLRHSMAYYRLKEGEKPETVRKILGNAGLSSLRGYRKTRKKENNGNF